MEYKKIPGEDRSKIVNKGTFAYDNIVTSNLSENELMINVLRALNCPIEKNCVELKDGPIDKVSSVCKFWNPPPPEITIGGKVVNCWHGDKPLPREGELLNAKGCCGYQVKCAACNDPEIFIVPNDDYPEKSHAYLICNRIDT